MLIEGMLQNDAILFEFRGPWGVPIQFGQSLAFLVGLLLYLNLNGNIMNGVIISLMLITIILLHELGHAWGNLIQGIPVRRIMIHGGGGFCEPGAPGSPSQRELTVAMGPLVNLALWALAGIALWALFKLVVQGSLGVSVPIGTLSLIAYYIDLFAFFNLLFFIFNLIPVQPLDGGKLLHLFLQRAYPPQQAQQITGAIGLAAAIAWIPLAIWGFLTFGIILFFFPSIPLHYKIMRGEIRL